SGFCILFVEFTFHRGIAQYNIRFLSHPAVLWHSDKMESRKVTLVAEAARRRCVSRESFSAASLPILTFCIGLIVLFCFVKHLSSFCKLICQSEMAMGFTFSARFIGTRACIVVYSVGWSWSLVGS